MFFHRYFLGKLSQKRLGFFIYILYRKECLQDKKTEVLKKSVKSKFSNGVSPYFFLILGKLSKKKKSSFDIVERKECFLDQKKDIFEKPIKSNHALCQKNDFFFHAYFLDKPTQKRYSGQKRMCLDQKCDVLKKPKKSKFSKGVSSWFL